MKKLLVAILSIILLLSTAMFVISCDANGDNGDNGGGNPPAVTCIHTWGTATCTQKAVCSICGEEYGLVLPHNYSELKKNENEHWYECTCGDKSGVETHKDGTATERQKAKCSVCNTEYGELEKPATEGLQFTLINNDIEYEVTGYIGSSTDVYIPNYYNGNPVQAFGEKALMGHFFIAPHYKQ